MIRRLALAALLAAMSVGMAPSVASADPAGPTDYETTVVSVIPDVDGLVIDVIGGDAFIRLVADPGVRVEVVGYGGEPYLLFQDGKVLENDLSPTKYVNQDRYAIAEVPDRASASADPQWVEVSSSGSYAWHDHRAHWMNPDPPPGAGPGDQILEGVIPLVVDGSNVDVTVASVWESGPSLAPALIGAALGLLIGLAVWRWGLTRGTTLVVLALALAATGVGLIGFLSVPPETAPSILAWLVPATAMGLAAWSWVSPQRAFVLLSLAGLELALWAFSRRGWVTAAITPTNLPGWVDRLVVPTVLVAGGMTLFALGRALWADEAPREPVLNQGASSRTSTDTTTSSPSAN